MHKVKSKWTEIEEPQNSRTFTAASYCIISSLSSATAGTFFSCALFLLSSTLLADWSPYARRRSSASQVSKGSKASRSSSISLQNQSPSAPSISLPISLRVISSSVASALPLFFSSSEGDLDLTMWSQITAETRDPDLLGPLMIYSTESRYFCSGLVL